MKLTDKQIEFGFNYFFRDEPQTVPRVIELSEYNKESELIINCTQLSNSYKAKDKKRILNEWCNFLTNNPEQFTKLKFGTRMPQELFDAVCHQVNLKELDVKWGVYKDISKIEKLQKLELLHLGSGSGVESILPISNLSNLKALSVENFQKITDYSPLTSLNKLESLSITGDGMSPRFIKVDTLKFIENLPNLRLFKFLSARLKDKDYSAVLHLKNVEHLSLRSEREVKKIYKDLIKLPNLKWGLLKSRPESYE